MGAAVAGSAYAAQRGHVARLHAACCMQHVVCCIVHAAVPCCMSHVVWYASLLHVVCYMAACRMLQFCMSYAACRMLYVACCMVCCMLHVVCCMSHVVCCIAACCMSHGLHNVCGMVCCTLYAACRIAASLHRCMLYAAYCMLHVALLHVVCCIAACCMLHVVCGMRHAVRRQSRLRSAQKTRRAIVCRGDAVWLGTEHGGELARRLLVPDGPRQLAMR
jgi:hypothetical protein